jgi:hypothetical protein
MPDTKPREPLSRETIARIKHFTQAACDLAGPGADHATLEAFAIGLIAMSGDSPAGDERRAAVCALSFDVQVRRITAESTRPVTSFEPLSPADETLLQVLNVAAHVVNSARSLMQETDHAVH